MMPMDGEDAASFKQLMLESAQATSAFADPLEIEAETVEDAGSEPSYEVPEKK